MIRVDVYSQDGAVTGEYLLSDEIFGVEVNEHVLHSAVVQYLANQRQGTKKTKNLRTVHGTGAKCRPQKGSGRSRQGSKRGPQWVGGGMALSLNPREFRFKLNKKVKRIALKSALSAKAAVNQIIVLEELKLNQIKTKEMKKSLDSLRLDKVLVVMETNDENVFLSARNLPNVKMALYNTINVYDILKYDMFVMTKAAADKIQEVYA